MSNWIKPGLCELNDANLDLLLNFKIPGIAVRGIIDPQLCRIVADRLRSAAFENYAHLKDIPVDQVGLCHNQWAHDDKSVYFGKVSAARQVIASNYEGLGLDPVRMVIERVAQCTGRKVDVFQEPGFGEYFAGAFRSFRGHGRLHVDHAPSHIRQHWAVTEIERQMTWNIYYSIPNTGGELVVYDTIHNAQNDVMKVPGDYYFPYEVLDDGSEHLKVIPQVGDLIIFNTQNFHEVLGNTNGSRISQSSFMGLRKDHSIGLWS